MTQVSVAILCYQQAHLVARTIQSALDQSRVPDEIVLVDDGSTDDSVVVARSFDGVRVVEHHVNRGRSATRNTLVSKVSGDILVFLDGDTVAEPGLIAHLERCYGHADVLGAGGRGIEMTTDTVSDRWRGAHATQNWGLQKLDDVPFLFGLSSSYRMDFLRSAGPFVGVGEDVDVGFRAHRHGGRLAYDPDAVVRHHRADDYGSLSHMLYRWWRGGFVAQSRYENHVLLSTLGRLGLDVVEHAVEDAFRRRDPLLLLMDVSLVIPRLQGVFRGAQIASREVARPQASETS